SQVFPTKVDGDKTSDFLVSLTLMRPRDIIQLCNCCRDTAQQNGGSSITAEDISRAARVYSTWKLTDLQNEWIVNYPFLPDICLQSRFWVGFEDHQGLGEAPTQIDPELLRSRFLRGVRVGQSFEDAPYPEKAVNLALRYLEEARISVEAGAMAEDLRREVRRN